MTLTKKILYLFAIIALLAMSPGSRGGGADSPYTIGADPGDDYVSWTAMQLTESEAAGETVSFRRGETFREQITVPASGSSGNEITYTSHGEGADPIISGADLVSTWAQCNGDEFSDNFDGNDFTGVWDTSGGVTAANGRAEVVVDNGGSDYINSNPQLTDRTEYWGFYRFQVLSAGLTWLNDNLIGLGGFYSAGWDLRLFLSLENDTGVIKMRYFYAEDGGDSEASADVTITANAYHDVALHWKSATGVGANDGICAIWVDGTEVLNLTTADSDTLDVDGLRLGNNWANAGVAATLYIEDAHLGTAPCNPDVYTATCAWTSLIVRENTATDTIRASTFAGVNAIKTFYSDGSDIYYRSSDDADPDTHTMHVGHRNYALDVNNVDYVTFENIHFTLGNNVNTGVQIQGTSGNINFDTCEISWNAKHGIYIDSSDSLYTIEDCTIHHNGLTGTSNGSGITFWLHTGAAAEKPISIKNNTVHNNRGTGIALETQYATCENNTVYDNGATDNYESGIKTHEGNGGGDGQNNIIRYNLIYNQVGGGNDGNGIQMDIGSADNEIYYNIIYNCDARGICVYDSTGINVYNNVCYGNCQNSSGELTTKSEISASTSDDSTTDINIKNNIGYATVASTYCIYVDSDTSGNTIDIDTNDWYRASGDWWYYDSGGGDSLATWNGKTGIGTDLNSTPLMIDPANDDFTLQFGSPCMNRGTHVGLFLDYLGLPVPIGHRPDIGAYEHKNGGSIIGEGNDS